MSTNKAKRLAEVEFEIARRLANKGEAGHAASHLGNAIYHDTENELYQVFVQKLVEGLEDPFEIAPLKETMYSQELGLRALIHSQRGEFHEAMQCLLPTLAIELDGRYNLWVLKWLKKTSDLTSEDLAAIGNYLGRLQEAVPSLYTRMSSWRRLLEPNLPLLLELKERIPRSNLAAVILSGVFRRLGEIEMAREIAQESHRVMKDGLSACYLAYALEELGQLDEATKLLEFAHQEEPEALDYIRDLALRYWEQKKFKEAAKLYQEAYEKSENDLLSQVAWHYLSFYHLDLSEAEKEPFKYLASQFGGELNHERFIKLNEAYSGYFVSPIDAAVSVINQVLADEDSKRVENPTKPFQVTSSIIDCPSAHIALRRLAKRLGYKSVDLRFQEIPAFDPRQNRKKITYQIWDYKYWWIFWSYEAKPALPAPNDEVVAKISTLALSYYDLDEWWVKAAAIAKSIGENNIKSLLAALTHPPTTPKKEHLCDWILKFQIATALVISRLSDDWRGSVRRDALYSMLHGPVDWIVSAATLVLSEVAQREPECLDEIRGELSELALFVAKREQFFCYAEYAMENTLRLPGLSPAVAQIIQKWRDLPEG